MGRHPYTAHRKEQKRRMTAWGAKLLAIQAYGGYCRCCAESEPVFLTFDHVDRSGAEHRASDPSAKNLAQWLVKHHYPDGFQLLCWNCHMAKDRGPAHLNGVCPHHVRTKRLPTRNDV